MGGTPKLSIYRRISHEINHPAIGDTSGYLWTPPHIFEWKRTSKIMNIYIHVHAFRYNIIFTSIGVLVWGMCAQHVSTTFCSEFATPHFAPLQPETPAGHGTEPGWFTTRLFSGYNFDLFFRVKYGSDVDTVCSNL